MKAFCNRNGVAMNSVRFLFDGNRVNPSQTPADLEMEDGDGARRAPPRCDATLPPCARRLLRRSLGAPCSYRRDGGAARWGARLLSRTRGEYTGVEPRTIFLHMRRNTARDRC